MKTMKSKMEKAPPAMVATGLVNRLTTAIKKERQRDQAEADRNLHAANVKFNGTWNSRAPGRV